MKSPKMGVSQGWDMIEIAAHRDDDPARMGGIGLRCWSTADKSHKACWCDMTFGEVPG